MATRPAIPAAVRALWQGQTSRHGGQDGTVPEAPDRHSVGRARLAVGTTAGAEGAALRGCRRGGGGENSARPQLVEVGQPESGQSVEEVGLGGADAVLRARAEGAAVCHAIIVRSAPPAAVRGRTPPRLVIHSTSFVHRLLRLGAARWDDQVTARPI